MSKKDYFLNINNTLLSISLSCLFIIIFTDAAQSATYQKIFRGDSSLLSEDGVYYRLLTNPINHLSIGEIIAAPYQPSSAIVSAEIIEGALPIGSSIFPNGLIVVDQPDLVKVGTYPLTVKITNEQDEETVTKFTLQITTAARPDSDAFYEMNQSTRIELLSEGEILAQPFDKDGSIQTAKCIMGNLPPGTQLTPEGKILVVDRKQLVSSVYNAAIVTVDKLGGTTFFMITVPINSEEDIRY